MARFEIRPATESDFEAICKIHIASILAQGPVAYTQEQCESWASGIEPALYDKYGETGEVFSVATDDAGDVIGFYSIKADELMALYVAPERARQGIGAALIKAAELEIGAAGHQTVRINASLNGLPFYLACGYQEQFRKMWTTRGGIAIETVALEKPLSE